jgi:hypothetical protein
MSNKPQSLVLLDDTVRHLRDHLGRQEAATPSMTGMICGLLSHWGRQVWRGETVIYPGVEKMAVWGGCKARMANYNLAVLRNWGVMEPVAYERGGRRATRYRVHPDALAKALVLLETNPSPELIEKLRNPAINPAINPATIAPGILSSQQGPCQGAETNVIPFNRTATPGRKT